MANWLSFWNTDTRRSHASLPGDVAVTSIYVPWGDGLIAPGDGIYFVGVEKGKLLAIGRLVAGTVKSPPSADDRVDVDADPGTGTVPRFDRVLDESTVDALAFRDATGKTQTIRDEAGRISGNRFQGRSSVRELIAGAPRLDEVLGLS